MVYIYHVLGKHFYVRSTYRLYVLRTTKYSYTMFFLGGENIKERLTTTLDYTVKQNMEIVMDEIGIKWIHFIHDSCIEFLKKHDANTYLKIKFAEQNETLAQMRTSTREMEESIKKLQYQIVEYNKLPQLENRPDIKTKDEFEDVREQYFNKNKEFIMQRFEEGRPHDLSFKNFIITGSFKTERDALAWTKERVDREKLGETT